MSNKNKEEDKVCPDIVVDETPEEAQADLKKEDPEEDEVEKTLASYGINISEYPPIESGKYPLSFGNYNYDFVADGCTRESVFIGDPTKIRIVDKGNK